jgi:hypothetical protein
MALYRAQSFIWAPVPVLSSAEHVGKSFGEFGTEEEIVTIEDHYLVNYKSDSFYAHGLHSSLNGS